MKKHLIATIGSDVCAYADIDLGLLDPEDTSMMIDLCRDAWDSGDLLFKPEWETREGHRIVSVTSQNGQETYLEDEPLEPVPHDAGLILATALRDAKDKAHFIELCCSAGPWLGMTKEFINQRLEEILK